MVNVEELQCVRDTNCPTDIVFCVDLTGAMLPCGLNVKTMAANFKDRFVKAMNRIGKEFTGGIRTKVIAFGDVIIGETKKVSPFYTMPEQEKEFQNFLNGLQFGTGGDEPRSAYEALIEAFNSEWVREVAKRRWITVLFSDAPAHTEKMHETVDAWNALDHNFKRLIIFAPNNPSWNDFTGQVSNTVFYQSEVEESWKGINCDYIFNALVSSI